MKQVSDLNFLMEVVGFTSFYIILIFVLIAIIIVAISSFKFFSFRRKQKATNILSSHYYYIINLKKQTVRRYNYRNFDGYKDMSFVEFISHFAESERDKAKTFFTSFASKKEIDQYSNDVVSSFVMINSKFKHFVNRILFKIIKVDYESGILYAESHRLFNLPCNLNKNRKKFKAITSTLGEIKKSYEDGFFAKGSFFIISFKKKENIDSFFNEYQIRYIILDELYRYFKSASSYFFFKDNDEFEIDLLDKNFIAGYDVKNMITRIIRRVTKVFENYGFDNVYFFTISGSLVSELNHDFDLSYRALKDRIEKNYEDNVLYSVYRKEEANEDAKTWAIRTDLLKVIKENLIKPSFRSIICLENNELKIHGYQVKFKVLYDKFKSLDDLKKDAKMNNNTKEIFSLCLKTAIPTYLTYRENYFTKLYIPINLSEIQYALLSIPYVKRSNEAHLVFVLDINEFLDLEDLTPAINTIKDVQHKGHEVAIRCTNGGFKIKTELGQVIDSFFVDLNLEENVKADSKSYIASHPFLDRLYQFHKPIIEVNAKSFSEVELLYRSGLTYFSSDVIQGYTEMIDKLDKKITKKLTNLINNN